MFWQSDAALTAPRLEGTIEVGSGRRLGFAEFGRPHGRTIIWMHGTPGARRQVPEVARIAADEVGLRIVGLDRPGVGASTPHRYDSMFDFTADLDRVLDCLGIDDFGMLGLSGAGPYILACASAMPDRMKVGGVLGGVAPTVGPDAPRGGIVGLSARFAPGLSALRAPLALGLMTGVWALRPLAAPTLRLYARFSPPGDREVLARPEMQAMFIDDLLMGGKPGLRAPLYDILLFGRDWGFSVRDISVPIRWWHGDSDHIVPVSHAEHVVGLIPDAELYVRPGESHLGTLGAAEEILGVLLETWDASAAARPVAQHSPNGG